jgi:hypothetical protein
MFQIDVLANNESCILHHGPLSYDKPLFLVIINPENFSSHLLHKTLKIKNILPVSEDWVETYLFTSKDRRASEDKVP